MIRNLLKFKALLNFKITMIALLLMTANSAHAVVVPVGLNPGDTYQLAFVTAGTRNAISSSIGTYNTFVQDEADLAGSLAAGASWSVIGSTETTNARDNAVVSGPVYLLDGSTIIANDFTDMWNGDIDAPINIDQFGNTVVSASVFTGTDTFGFSHAFGFLAAFPAGNIVGQVADADAGWINDGANTRTDSLRFYALSDVLTVVPEPSSFVLLLVAGAAFRRRARRMPRC